MNDEVYEWPAGLHRSILTAWVKLLGFIIFPMTDCLLSWKTKQNKQKLDYAIMFHIIVRWKLNTN